MIPTRGLSCLIVGLLLVVFPCLAQDKDKPAGPQQAKKLDKEIQVRVKVDYLLYLPEGYEQSDKPWPLIVFLHGAGESGSNLNLVKKHGPPKLVEGGKKLPFVVVSPQAAEFGWKVDALNALLDDVLASYKVDPNRVYLTGLSMGGFGTWSWAAAHPNRFAAIAPICGGGNAAQAARIKHVPTWAFHGAKDRVVPLQRSEDMINAIKKAGGNPKFTVYPDADHDSWTQTYDNPELYDWFLQQRRDVTFWSGIWKGDKEGYGGNLLCEARKIGDNLWAAAFSGYCGRDYLFDIEMKGTREPGSDVVKFEGEVDLGQQNGGKYQWSGEMSASGFTGKYLTEKGGKGQFSMKLEKK